MLKISGTSSLPVSNVQSDAKKTPARQDNTVEEISFKKPSLARDRTTKESSSEELLDKLENAINLANRTSDAINVSLRFRLHEGSERYMVQIVDIEENEVIKEIPPEKILNLVAQIQDLIGLLLDEKR